MSPEAALGGIGGARVRDAPAAFHAGEQRGFFAADEPRPRLPRRAVRGPLRPARPSRSSTAMASCTRRTASGYSCRM
jgi:hypothetical protein